MASLCSSSETIHWGKSAVSAADLSLPAIQNLLPYYNYTMSVVAVNEKGKGDPATVTETTLEEGIQNFI